MIATATLLALLAVAVLENSSASATSRDGWQRPFVSTSIWNMPIGSGAVYSSVGPAPALYGVYPDPVHMVRTTTSDPVIQVVQSPGWFNRCTGTVPTSVTTHFPSSYMIADVVSASDQPNNHLVVLQPDGHTIVQIVAAARCTPGGPLYGYVYGTGNSTSDVYGDGRFGTHASQLSALGGSIRAGELTSTTPINHVLDLEFYEGQNYNYGGGGAGCFRWPANSCDSYASPSTYGGTNPDFKIGALLAIPPSVTPQSLGITTPAALKVFQALQNYGAYATESTAWSAYNVAVDKGAVGEFPQGTARDEISRLISSLRIVTNNSATSVGGGGTPRLPLLAPLGTDSTTSTVVATTTTAPITTASKTVSTPTTTTAPTTTTTTAPTTTTTATTTTTTSTTTTALTPTNAEPSNKKQRGKSWHA